MRLEEIILLAALGFAGFLMWQLHKARLMTGPAPSSPVAPPGEALIKLGQFAVRPEARWLVLQGNGGVLDG
jgi:hypothetical protein